MPASRPVRRRWAAGAATLAAAALIALVPALPAAAVSTAYTDSPVVAQASVPLGTASVDVSGSCAAASWDPLAGQSLTNGVVSLNYQVADSSYAPIGASTSVQFPIPTTGPDWSTTLTIDYSAIGAAAAGDYLQLWFDCHDPAPADPANALSIVSGGTSVPFVAAPAPHVGAAPAPTAPASIPFDGSTASATVSGVCTDPADSAFSAPDATILVLGFLTDASTVIIAGPVTTTTAGNGGASWSTTVAFPVATAVGQNVAFSYICNGHAGATAVSLTSDPTLVPVVAATDTSADDPGPGASSGSDDPVAAAGSSNDPGALASTGTDATRGSWLAAGGAALLLGGAALLLIGRRRARRLQG